jgi:type II secretory pathway pseudopilin PulG
MYLSRKHTSIRTLRDRGDTIVEVLVVLAVIGFALSISYSSATRSLTDAQQSEENSYAAELAQTQVEQIREAVITSAPDSTGKISNLSPQMQGLIGQPFCMTAGTAKLTSTIPNPCSSTAGGTTYTLRDTLQQIPPTAPIAGLPFVNNFKVQVTWPDVLGQGYDTVTLFYRVYPQPS